MICVQAEDPLTLFAGLRSINEELHATAHLHLGGKLSGAWICLDDESLVESIGQRVGKVPLETGHWIRVRVEDKENKKIIFDETYHPSHEASESVGLG
jgi:hypothetical protein